MEHAEALTIVAKPIANGFSEGISAIYHRTATGEETVDVTGAPASESSLALYTSPPGKSGNPPIMGRVISDSKGLRFEPRFPLQHGLTFYVQCLAGDESIGIYSFTIPKKVLEPETTVAAVFPSRSELPENLLKFYLHFSNPMSKGDVYQYIRLLDESGEPLDLPFLELGEELWDYDTQRLTLLFDPGRIKTGLVPNLEEGMVLERGKSYTLQIDKDWRDAEGRPLVEGFEKQFTVGPADTVSPKLDNWRKYWPRLGTRQPVTLIFPESLDEALLQRVIVVLDETDNLLAGSVNVSKEETRWEFIPDQPWDVGKYRIKIETLLEDVAGNSIARPFELDKELSESYQKSPKVVYLNLVFQ